MNQEELVKKVARKTGLKIKDSRLIIDTALKEIMEQVACGNHVLLTNFGTFENNVRKARKTVNPYSGEDMFVPKITTPHFKPSKNFKKITQQYDQPVKRKYW